MPKKPRLINDLPNGPKCSDCSYRSESRGFTEPVLRPETLLTVLGEASGFWEIHERVPYAGKSGGALNGYLALANKSRLDCSILNSVCCRPIQYELCPYCDGDAETFVEFERHSYEFGYFDHPIYEPCLECEDGYRPILGLDGDHKNKTPEPGQIIECMERYGHEHLRTLSKQRLIIATGASALFALTGNDNLGSYRGSVVESSQGPALVTYHPAFIMHDERMEPVVRRDFARIPAILSGAEGAGLEIRYVREPRDEQIYERDGTPAVDLETTGGLDPLTGGDILLGSASWRPGESFIIPAGDPLRKFLRGCTELVGQNFYSYDAWWLHHRGYPVPERIVDTKVLAHAANSATPNDLYFIQSQYAEPPMSFWKSRDDYAGDIELVALRDTDATKRSEIGLVAHLKREGQWELCDRVLIPWCRLAFELRRDGVRADVGLLDREGKRIHEGVVARGQELSERTGVPIPKRTKTGIPSYQAIKKYLYGELALPEMRHPKTGKVTTDQPRLKRLWKECKARDDASALAGSSFIETLHGRPNAEEGQWTGGLIKDKDTAKDMRKFAKRGMDEDGTISDPIIYLHCEPYITGTETGRLSWELLHQVPLSCKPFLLPDPGHVLLQFDYKQIELLVMLYEAEEWELLDRCINDGYDLHSMTAADFYNKPYDVIHTKRRDLRSAIKPISLGRPYGKGAKSTALDLDMKLPAVQEIYDRYDKFIPGLARYQQQELEIVRRRGYIQTEYGWRRYFTREEQHHAHRSSVATEAYNTRIQSNAAMRTREAIVDIWKQLKLDYGEGVGSAARILLSVHDSGVISVAPAKVREVAALVRELATAPCQPLLAPRIGMAGGVRFPIDLEVGNHWGRMIPYEEWIK